MKITIPIHSFVDLITNSSSETFISPSKNTVKIFYSLVQKFLDNGKFTANPLWPVAEDVVKITLQAEVYDEVTRKYILSETYDPCYRAPRIVVEFLNGWDKQPEVVNFVNSLKEFGGTYYLNEICN